MHSIPSIYPSSPLGLVRIPKAEIYPTSSALPIRMQAEPNGKAKAIDEFKCFYCNCIVDESSLKYRCIRCRGRKQLTIDSILNHDQENDFKELDFKKADDRIPSEITLSPGTQNGSSIGSPADQSSLGNIPNQTWTRLDFKSNGSVSKSKTKQNRKCNKCQATSTCKWYTDRLSPGHICKACYIKRRKSHLFDGVEGVRRCIKCFTSTTSSWYQDAHSVGYICKKCATVKQLEPS